MKLKTYTKAAAEWICQDLVICETWNNHKIRVGIHGTEGQVSLYFYEFGGVI